MKKIIYTLCALPLLFFAGCGDCGCDDYQTTKVENGQKVPGFELTSTNGSMVYNSLQANKLTLIYFLWSECSDCKKVTPEVMTVWKEIMNNPDVELVCIARGDTNATIEKAEAYWAQVGLTIAPTAMPPLYYDENRLVFNMFADSGVPRFYLVGTDGTVVWQTFETIITAKQLLEQINMRQPL